MKNLFGCYVSSYIKFAEASLAKTSGYIDLVRLANLLTQKANQLTLRGSLHKVDSYLLQLKLSNIGISYIKRFSARFRPSYDQTPVVTLDPGKPNNTKPNNTKAA